MTKNTIETIQQENINSLVQLGEFEYCLTTGAYIENYYPVELLENDTTNINEGVWALIWLLVY